MMDLKTLIIPSILLLLIISFTSCATYYEKNLLFQEQFISGQVEEASKTLDKNKKAAKDKDRLLYFLQKGIVNQLLGNYDTSNEFFEKAYILTEDYRKSYSQEMVSLLSNPSVKNYQGEDHELVLMHYFKIINFLKLDKYDEALVECRRINNKLNLLNDRYEKKKNRYSQDAFALNLMGITYEASGDLNNAFIAYKNAEKAYVQYEKNFNTPIPPQLKIDLLRTAYLNNFTDELAFYEEKFSMKYQHKENKNGELLFLWHNGLGPVKDEWSINFFIVKGKDGMILFVNEELGLSFPFPLSTRGADSGGIGNLKFVRVAFPKLLERKPYFRSAELSFNNKTYPLQLAQNINEIAEKTLEDRMIRELGNSLLRLAVKQSLEVKASQKSQSLGALLSAFNAVSEKTDTRNWQTLPYSISYTRIPLEEGDNTFKLTTYSPQKSRTKEHHFSIPSNKKESVFYIHHTVESIPISENYK